MKVLFIHNTAMPYRIPFFRRLGRVYDVTFLFTHFNVCQEIYGLHPPETIKELEGLRHKILRNRAGFALGLFKEILLGEYDLVVGGGWNTLTEVIESSLSLLIAKLRKKSFVHWSEEWHCGRGPQRVLAVLLARLLLPHCDAVVVPGSKHKEFIVSLGILPERVFVVPNTTNLVIKEEDYVYRDSLREKLHTKEQKVVLYVGRLAKRKGAEYLIKAFANLARGIDQVTLILAGRGKERDKLRTLCSKLEIEERVIFLGFVSDEELAGLYLLCDVFVIPSVTTDMGEPWGLVVNEAMTARKPVIATNVVGAAFDMIKNGVNGFVVPEKDIDSLSKAIERILLNENLATRMGEVSLKIVENEFTYEKMVERFSQAVRRGGET